MNKYILLTLHFVSIIFLGLGLVMDILQINITATFFIDINLFNEKRSVLGTLQSLWQSGNFLPFLLIFCFGILVPFTKTLVLFYLLLAKPVEAKWLRFVKLSSKWAMADVFAVSIFIAFLGAQAMKNTTATLGPGFYYFTGYVLLSAIIGDFLTKSHKMGLPSHS